MELTIRDYAAAAKRTINPSLDMRDAREHALHGIASECGEIHGLYQKVYQGHELSKERVMDEMGDLMWFIMELCFAEGIDPQEVLEYNIDKLRKRYPEGFSAERSVHRPEYEKAGSTAFDPAEVVVSITPEALYEAIRDSQQGFAKKFAQNRK